MNLLSPANMSQSREPVHENQYLSGSKQHTQSPIVTGTSVIAVKFKDGVIIAADNLGKPT